MKKILSWYGSHTELLCAFFLMGCCLSSAVKDGWSTAILFLPFIVMWIYVYRLQKEISRITKKNKELNEAKKKLEKACKRTKDLKTLIYYRYLLAKNDVDLCKKKIDCNAYLYERRHCEEMIEFILKRFGIKMYDNEVR